jgi:hypothetical protein
MPIYEYLVLIYTFETDLAEVEKHDAKVSKQYKPGMNLGEWQRLEKSYISSKQWKGYYIWRPNARTAEKRSAEDAELVTLFNEFGRDGWKLIVTDIPASTISHDDDHGWPEIGVAIHQRWTFMREVAS